MAYALPTCFSLIEFQVWLGHTISTVFLWSRFRTCRKSSFKTWSCCLFQGFHIYFLHPLLWVFFPSQLKVQTLSSRQKARVHISGVTDPLVAVLWLLRDCNLQVRVPAQYLFVGLAREVIFSCFFISSAVCVTSTSGRMFMQIFVKTLTSSGGRSSRQHQVQRRVQIKGSSHRHQVQRR